MRELFDEIEDLVLYYATDDYDYKKSVALFNVGKIEKMVDYCRYLQTRWDSLREFLEAMIRIYKDEYKDIDVANHYRCVLDKMNELEGVSDEK